MRWPDVASLPLPRRLLRLLGVSTRPQTTFTSFSSYLPALVKWARPERVLEFGPGTSSRIILESSNARILSFETDAAYYDRAKSGIRSERFDVRYTPNGPDFAALAGSSFDLVFVDGGDRVANLIGAHPLLREDGILVLHDAHREDYLPGVQRYPHGYFIENHSLVLFKSRARFDDVVARFPPDSSCACKYCGTEGRIEYRRSVAQALQTGEARA